MKIKIKNIYYYLWADAIQRFRHHNPDRTDWKFAVYSFITFIHALNFWVIILWLKYFKLLILPIIEINIFLGTMLNGLISFLVTFASPFIVANYFLIFNNNRYEKILKKYPLGKTNYSIIYTFSVAILALISGFLYGFLTK